MYQGDNIVLTPYSQVTVQVAKIKSVSDDPDLRGAYENSVKDAKATLKLDNLSADLLEQGCNQFTALMQDRNFQRKILRMAWWCLRSFPASAQIR